MTKPNLAATVDRLRKKRGMSQLRLARESGLSPSYVNDIVRGRKWRISAATREKLSVALDIQPERLGDVS